MVKVTEVVTCMDAYEAWLDRAVPTTVDGRAEKHRLMAESPFAFLRASYPRWLTLVADLPAPPRGPVVAAVGDLHVDNFGTWRDLEGRLVWGVNDLDEADHLPASSDLLRLATSAVLAQRHGALHLSESTVIDLLFEGYSASLDTGGLPAVLDRPDAGPLSRLEFGHDPDRWWNHLLSAPTVVDPPPRAVALLRQSLPSGARLPVLRRRVAGMGSRDRLRLVAVVDLAGAPLAREAKAAAPPATWWLHEPRRGLRVGDLPTRLASTIRHSADPGVLIRGRWIVRRLAPWCDRVELTSLRHEREAEDLIRAMGAETANVHLASAPAAELAVIVGERSRRWLHGAVESAAEATVDDWRAWARHLATRKDKDPSGTDAADTPAGSGPKAGRSRGTGTRGRRGASSTATPQALPTSVASAASAPAAVPSGDVESAPGNPAGSAEAAAGAGTARPAAVQGRTAPPGAGARRRNGARSAHPVPPEAPARDGDLPDGDLPTEDLRDGDLPADGLPDDATGATGAALPTPGQRSPSKRTSHLQTLSDAGALIGQGESRSSRPGPSASAGTGTGVGVRTRAGAGSEDGAGAGSDDGAGSGAGAGMGDDPRRGAGGHARRSTRRSTGAGRAASSERSMNDSGAPAVRSEGSVASPEKPAALLGESAAGSEQGSRSVAGTSSERAAGASQDPRARRPRLARLRAAAHRRRRLAAKTGRERTGPGPDRTTSTSTDTEAGAPDHPSPGNTTLPGNPVRPRDPALPENTTLPLGSETSVSSLATVSPLPPASSEILTIPEHREPLTVQLPPAPKPVGEGSRLPIDPESRVPVAGSPEER